MTFQLVVGPPVRDDASYVSRRADKVFDQLIEQGRWTSVIGPPRLGKSSLLLRGMRAARARGHRAAYVSLNSYSTNDPARWLTSVLAEIHERLSGAVRETPAPPLGSPPEGDLRAWVVRTLRGFTTEWNVPIALFLDEVGELAALPPDAVRDIVEAFSVVQTEEDQRGRLLVVIAGVIDPRDVRQTSESSWLSFEHLHLGDFCEDEIAPITRELGGAVEDPEAWMKAILGWTSGHPMLTQWCAREVTNGSRLPEAGTPAERVETLIRNEILGESAPPHNLVVGIEQELHRRVPDKLKCLDILALYQQLLDGAIIRVDWNDEGHRWLRVLGLARMEGERRDERLVLRNRIVREYFGESWLRQEIAGLNRPWADEAVSRQWASSRAGRGLSMAGLRERIDWYHKQQGQLSRPEEQYLYALSGERDARRRTWTRWAAGLVLAALALGTWRFAVFVERRVRIREQNAAAQQTRVLLATTASDDEVRRVEVLQEYVKKLADLDRTQANRGSDSVALSSGHFDAHVELLTELQDLLPRLRGIAALRPNLAVAVSTIASLQASLRNCDPSAVPNPQSLVAPDAGAPPSVMVLSPTSTPRARRSLPRSPRAWEALHAPP